MHPIIMTWAKHLLRVEMYHIRYLILIPLFNYPLKKCSLPNHWSNTTVINKMLNLLIFFLNYRCYRMYDSYLCLCIIQIYQLASCELWILHFYWVWWEWKRKKNSHIPQYSTSWYLRGQGPVCFLFFVVHFDLLYMPEIGSSKFGFEFQRLADRKKWLRDSDTILRMHGFHEMKEGFLLRSTSSVYVKSK